MIARRYTLMLLGGALGSAVIPLAAQTRRLPQVVLVLGTAPANAIIGAAPKAAFVRSFVEGLAEAGWIDGSNVTIERRSAEGDPGRARAILAEVLARAPDVIAVGGERWLIDAARGATRTIPIVANLVDDPVASGLVASLARPGGNLTGITEATGPEFDGKRLQLLREMAPAAYRIAFIASSRRLDQFHAVPLPPRVSILPARLDTLGELEAAFAAIADGAVQGLMVSNDGPTYFGLPRIVAFAAAQRLPAIYAVRDGVDAGGLMSYGAVNRFAQIARMAARFLDGAKPGDVPVEQPTQFRLAINAKAAASLGLDMPRALAAQADEVIE